MSGFARRWWPLLALLVLLAALQSKLWMGDGGLPDARALRKSVEQQRAENAKLEQRNDALSAEVEDLKSGEAAVEERARSELGMVKPGETFYRVVEPHNAASVVKPAPAELPSPAGNATAKPAEPESGVGAGGDASEPPQETTPP